MGTSVRKYGRASVRTPVPVAGSDFSPPGLTMQNGKPFSFASSFNRSSALTFSRRTGLRASYTCGGGAPRESPVPMDVTRTNLGMRPCSSPFFTHASMRLMFPTLSAVASAGVPPIVDTTASYSSTMSFKASRLLAMARSFDEAWSRYHFKASKRPCLLYTSPSPRDRG